MSRLARLISLTSREAEHLLGVRERLLENVQAQDITEHWLDERLADPLGIDRLESFGAKFARLQDTLVDKLIPALLEAAGEPPGAAIDNLARMEKLDLVSNAEEWIAMRRLRNRLVHEYIESPADMLPALQAALAFTDVLVSTRAALAAWCEARSLTSPAR